MAEVKGFLVFLSLWNFLHSLLANTAKTKFEFSVQSMTLLLLLYQECTVVVLLDIMSYF